MDFGPINVIDGGDERRGYCYPAILKTNDGCLLISYCRGDVFLHGEILDSTGIVKIKIDTID